MAARCVSHFTLCCLSSLTHFSEGKQRSASHDEGTFARRVPGALGIQMNVLAIYHNALPPNITPSSSPGNLSTSTLYDCWRSTKSPFFHPTNGTTIYTLPLYLKIKESPSCV